MITLRADEWCPYNCDPSSDRPGYMIEIATEIFEAAGHSVDYRILNWSRSLEETRRGRYSAVVGAIPEEVPDFVLSGVLGLSTDGLAVRAGTAIDLSRPNPFNGLILAAISDYGYGEPPAAYISANADDPLKVQIIAGDDALERNLRKLMAGRVDIVVDDMYVLAQLLAERGIQQDVDIIVANQPNPVFIAFSPADPRAGEFAEILAEGTQRLRTSGRLDEILARYGLSDWD